MFLVSPKLFQGCNAFFQTTAGYQILCKFSLEKYVCVNINLNSSVLAKRWKIICWLRNFIKLRGNTFNILKLRLSLKFCENFALKTTILARLRYYSSPIFFIAIDDEDIKIHIKFFKKVFNINFAQ